jgi:glycosyltransferase involved in cell wall biosynthesis
LRQIGIGENNIRVIYNGITDIGVGTRPEVQISESFRIGIAGQITPSKGHDDLLQAVALVFQRCLGAELHIYGTGESKYVEELTLKANILGIADRIKWHDFVFDRRAIYSNLDVCVIPSRSSDPLPTSAIESGLFGKACIATRRGGLPEIITHGVNGLLVESGQPREIAEAICRLIEYPDLRRTLGMNARRQAIERFNPERFLRDFLEVL